MNERFGKKQEDLKHWYLKEWRKFFGLTQEQVAHAIQTTKAHISRYEKHHIPYNQPVLEALSDLFNCSPADLISGPPDAIEIDQKIAGQLHGMNDEQKLLVYNIINAIQSSKVKQTGETCLHKTFISEWREMRGLSLEDVAEIVGLQPLSYMRMEAGKEQYSQQDLEVISEALDCRPADLLLGPPKLRGG